MIENAEAPLFMPHAVVPHGQTKGDAAEHAVVSPGQGGADGDVPVPDVSRLRKMFDDARDLTDKDREEQQKDQDYYDGPGQADSETRRVLELRKQPLIIDNRIAPAIDGILGVIETGKVDPRAFPRNPQDQGSADIATKTLRYIADRAKWQKVKMECCEDYLKQGLTAAIVEWDGQNIAVNQIRWETFFYDPRSRKADFSDAKYRGVAKWMYTDEVKSHPDYGQRATELGDLIEPGSTSIMEESWQDRPCDKWVDRVKNRVMVVEIYYLHAGEWLRCVFCAAGWLEYARSPYINPITQRSRCPIVAQSFKVDRKNGRYGPIRNMRYMQDEVNARRSRGLHLLNSRQVQMIDPSAPPVDDALVRMEAAKADGVMPFGWGMVPTTDMASGNLNMLAEAKESLSRMVPVALAQDLREGTASSGRARQVAQQAGLTQFGRGFGQLEDFEAEIYEQMWLCAQQFWTGPMYVRTTDNPRAPEFLQINEPAVDEAGQPVLAVDERGFPQMQPMMGQDGKPAMDAMGQPQMQPVQQVNHHIAAMDMDIIVGTSPDTAALEQEVFETLSGMIQAGMDPLSPAFQIMIEFAPLPDKVRLLERLEALKKEIQEAQAQQAQAEAERAAKAEAIGEATAVADIENTKADTAVKTATALEKMAKRHTEEMHQESEASGANEDREDYLRGMDNEGDASV
jgi:hypothetical protein